MLRNANHLKNFRLGAIDGEIGAVKEFYIDDVNWKVRYLVADTGHWLPRRKVLIPPHALKDVDEERKSLHVDLSREQIEKSPSIDAERPVSRQFEEEYLRYFGWPFYWMDPALWGTAPTSIPPSVPVENIRPQPAAQGDPNLRNTNELVGYHIQAIDGEIGHVEDFLIDDEDWSIRYLVVDTRNWLPGKRVLVSPLWIERVSWEDAKVFVDLQRDAIKEAPEYDAQNHIGRDYEERLFKAYDRMTYWP
jgi:hypothetical protein